MKYFSFKRLFVNGDLGSQTSDFRSAKEAARTKKHIPRPRSLRAESLEDRALLSATPEGALLDATAYEPITSQIYEAPTIATTPITIELEADTEDSNVAEQGAVAYTIDDSLLDLNVDPNALTENFVFNLSSNPNSTYTIYLDFDGHETKGTYWNEDHGTIITPAYDTDGDTSSFSQSELHDIYEIWLRVSEDYAPFDVNVTTKEPTLDQLIRTDSSDHEYGIRGCIGGSWDDWLHESCGGIAYVGSFTWNSDTPCYAFSGEGCGAGKGAAEAIAHEIGHTLKLGHDGIKLTEYSEYYSGANDWGPIMGAGYSVSLTQWSKGEYTGATNQEDDLAIITSNGFSYKADDYCDLRVQAATFDLASSGTLLSGVIETSDDIDFFSFVNSGVTENLYVGGVEGVTNLDVVVTLYDADGNLVKTYDPSNSYYVVVDLNELEVGATYYFSVSGTGLTVGDALYYTDYASLGNYTIVAKQDDAPLDAFEPNNTFTQASNLGFVNSNVVYDSLVIGSNEDLYDYYKFEIGATGTSSNYVKTQYDKTADPDRIMYLGLYDSAHNLIKYCFYSNTDQQTVSLEGIGAGTYFLKMYNYTTLDEPYEYTLTIDAPAAQVPTYPLTTIKIANEPQVGSTLLSILEYQDATANYQWYYADSADSTTWTPIQGATGASFSPTRLYVGKYLKVVAEGTGLYEGTVEAVTGSAVKLTKVVELIDLNSVSITGTLSVGQKVVASLAPSGATATYQWYRATTSTSQKWTKLEGANAAEYSPTNADVGYFLKVVATGAGDYTGEVSAVSNMRVVKSSTSLKSVSLSGNLKTGETISATLQPTGATADYQWYRATSNDASASWNLISGATSANYVPDKYDVGCYLKVVATGSGVYSGEVSAVSTGKVAANFITLTSISISGTFKVGETASTTLRPGGATVDYQWYRATSSSATEWTAISGANEATYLQTAADVGYYLKVVATGTGNYTGEVSAVSTGKVEENLEMLSSISISGAFKVGVTLTTTLRPNGATATYQWYRATLSSATEWTAISGANEATYQQTSADVGYYLKVVATGSGKYSGEVSAVSTGKVESPLESLSSIIISGSFNVGNTLTTTLRPNGATANYQWYRSSASSTTEWTAISGANESTYKITEADFGLYLKVVAVGTGNYSGEVSKIGASTVVMNLTSISIAGNLKVDETLSTSIQPTDATVEYQWYRATSASSQWIEISGANDASYTATSDDLGYYLKVVATGTGSYVGKVSAVSSTAVAANTIPLVSVSISGVFSVGETLTATLRPSGATADYQWYRATSNSGAEWTEIEGADKATYKIADSDVGYYLMVVASGTGKYEGDVFKATTKPIDGLTAPTDLVVSDFDATSKTVKLTWTDNSSLEKGFRIEVSADGGKSWKLSGYAGIDATEKTCSVPQKDCTYMFRVAEYAGKKYSAWSNTATVQTVPYAPNMVKFAFDAGSATSGVLTWRDTSKTETAFVVERSANGGEWEAIGETGVNATKFAVADLASETNYSFRVVAKNDFASATSSAVSVATVPAAPGDLLVTQGSSSRSFVLTWTDNSNVEKGFKVQYSTNGGKTWMAKTTVKANVTTTTIGLNAKSEVLFRVAAYNNAGISEWTTGSLEQTEPLQTSKSEVFSDMFQSDEEDAFWKELEDSLKN